MPVQPSASVATTTIGNPPDCVGVPARTPFESSERPFGSGLAVENVVVPTPPVCVKVWLKGTFTVPVVATGFVTAIVWHAMTSV